MDSAGRIVIPKALRRRRGCGRDLPLRIELREGRIEIEPVQTAVRLVEDQGVWVAEPTVPYEPLEAGAVRDLVDELRGRGGVD